MSKRKVRINRERTLLDFSVLPDYEALCELVDILEERYPFLRVSSLGTTILSKKIFMLSLGNKDAEKSVLYVGAHHGTEWMTTLILLRFVNELCEYYKNSKQPFGINVHNLFSTRRLYFVLQLNADGVDLHLNGLDEDNILRDRLLKMSGGDFSKWKSNARGVDLNHNYDCGFFEYKSLERDKGILPGSTRYSGEYPLSEPETMALANFIRLESTLEMILTLHSAGEEIYCSSCGEMPVYCERIGKKLSALSGYKLSYPEGLSAFGGLTDWYIKEFCRPSFTIECGTESEVMNEKNYYAVYARIREMLLWTPLLI